jgi:hypothetical protein
MLTPIAFRSAHAPMSDLHHAPAASTLSPAPGSVPVIPHDPYRPLGSGRYAEIESSMHDPYMPHNPLVTSVPPYEAISLPPGGEVPPDLGVTGNYRIP